VQGGVGLTLLDSMDALLVFNETDEFSSAVRLVEKYVDFNVPQRVHVFELNIRYVSISFRLIRAVPLAEHTHVDTYLRKQLIC
jgi:hypothetical protein